MNVKAYCAPDLRIIFRYGYGMNKEKGAIYFSFHQQHQQQIRQLSSLNIFKKFQKWKIN
jgi:hypothetical protein